MGGKRSLLPQPLLVAQQDLGHILGMSWTADSKDVNPFQRIALFAVLTVGAILFIITRFYHTPPVPSPFGCYKGAGTPVVVLGEKQVVIGGGNAFHRIVLTERSKNGYMVQPGFAFERRGAGTLSPVESYRLVLIEAKPRHLPSMKVAVGDHDDVLLNMVPCRS